MISCDSEILAEKSKKFLFVAAMLLALFLIILVAFIISIFYYRLYEEQGGSNLAALIIVYSLFCLLLVVFIIYLGVYIVGWLRSPDIIISLKGDELTFVNKSFKPNEIDYIRYRIGSAFPRSLFGMFGYIKIVLKDGMVLKNSCIFELRSAYDKLSALIVQSNHTEEN